MKLVFYENMDDVQADYISAHNALSYSEKRIRTERHPGFHFVDRLIICGHKGLLKGDLLIDDNIQGKVQEHFEGRLIHFGSERSRVGKRVELGFA